MLYALKVAVLFLVGTVAVLACMALLAGSASTYEQNRFMKSRRK